MKASPMSKPISSKFSSPKIAAMIGMITPLMKASTIYWKYSAITKPTAIVMTLPLIDEVLVLAEHFFMGFLLSAGDRRRSPRLKHTSRYGSRARAGSR